MKKILTLREQFLPYVIRRVAWFLGREKRPAEFHKAYSAYRGTLPVRIFPDSKKGVIFCFVGLTASGKSTVANVIKSLLPDTAVINGNQIRVILRKKGGLSYEKYTHLIAEDVVRELIPKGMNVVLDSDFVDHRKRASMRQIARKLGAEIYFIRTILDPQEARKRVEEAAKRGEIEEFFTGAHNVPSAFDVGTQEHGREVKLHEMERRMHIHFKDAERLVLQDLPFICDLIIDTTYPVSSTMRVVSNFLGRKQLID